MKNVLSVDEFNAFVMRERDLADRGTRLFSLIVVHERGAPNGGLRRVARRLRERLRSTDLVGQLDNERIGVLLSDTGPTGAKVICDWASGIAEMHGVDIDATIYVYPTVVDGPGEEHDDTHGNRLSNGHNGHSANGHSANGHSNGHGGSPTGRGAPIGTNRAFTSVRDSICDLRAGEHGEARRRWKVADLWPELSIPTPTWKRALDVASASLALIALAPLFALIALAIKLDSSGPVIFRQPRAGRGGRSFTFYKFRSMCVDAERRRAALLARNEQSGPVFKIHDDPRVTRVGRLLRRWSLDELPQLWNVLKGDISLVGPRSPTFDEVSQYERWQRRRLNVTGGLTCFWQVSGRSRIAFHEWMRMDRWYVERRCLALDLWLLLRTLPAVVSGRGAC